LVGVVGLEWAMMAPNEAVRRAGVTQGPGQQVVAQEDSVQSAERGGLTVEGVAQAEGVELITRAGRT
jgi:hypothetical protein